MIDTAVGYLRKFRDWQNTPDGAPTLVGTGPSCTKYTQRSSSKCRVSVRFFELLQKISFGGKFESRRFRTSLKAKSEKSENVRHCEEDGIDDDTGLGILLAGLPREHLELSPIFT